MTGFVPSDIHLAEDYIEFLENDPTVIEFLEQKKRLGYNYDSARRRRRSLHFKKVIENERSNLEEKIIQSVAQAIKEQLDRIVNLTLRVSQQLEIIERHIQSNDLMIALRLNDRDELRKFIREVRKLRFMLYREI